MGRVCNEKEVDRQIKTINKQHAFPDGKDPPLTCTVCEKEPILIRIIVKFQSASDKEDSKNLGGGRTGGREGGVHAGGKEAKKEGRKKVKQRKKKMSQRHI